MPNLYAIEQLHKLASEDMILGILETTLVSGRLRRLLVLLGTGAAKGGTLHFPPG